MVLDVFVEGCDDSFGCQYSGFGKFRCEIIRGWNEELGELYERKYGFLWDRKGSFFIGLYMMQAKHDFYEDLDKRMEEILDEYDKPYNEGMKLFFNHSDSDGEFTPAECELILKSFEHVDPEKFDKSDDYYNKWYRESYVVWIRMLKYAIENNKSILFG